MRNLKKKKKKKKIKTKTPKKNITKRPLVG